MFKVLQAEMVDFKAVSHGQKAWRILSAVATLAVILSALRWTLGPSNAESVKRQALEECRGLAMAMVDLSSDYKGMEKEFTLKCVANKLQQGLNN